jgi:hypothetical protein
MRNYIQDLLFSFYNRSKAKQQALVTFSTAIRIYLGSLVTLGPSAVRGAVVTSFGGVLVSNDLYWEEFHFIDDGMTPVYKVHSNDPNPYGYVRFDFFGTKYSKAFVKYLYLKLLDEGYNISYYSGGYMIAIFVSTDKIYGEKPYPFLPQDN